MIGSLSLYIVVRQHFQTTHLKALGYLVPFFHIESQGVGETKVCLNGCDRLTNTSATLRPAESLLVYCLYHSHNG